MSLSFASPRGTVEQRWIVYALLRDNVQHHAEGGVRSAAFEALHRAGDALGGGHVEVSARQLFRELQRAQAALGGRPIADLAISARTRAVIDRTWPVPEASGLLTMLAREQGVVVPWLDPGMTSCDQVFGHLVRELIAITADAGEADIVEVRDL